MGKLAERYGDAARSGVYRVADGGIPRSAAREAGALLVEIGVRDLSDGGGARVREAVAAQGARACVVLVPDAAALLQPAHAAALGLLQATARSCGEAGRPFFAVLVDPGGQLRLPPLYHERPPP